MRRAIVSSVGCGERCGRAHRSGTPTGSGAPMLDVAARSRLESSNRFDFAGGASRPGDITPWGNLADSMPGSEGTAAISRSRNASKGGQPAHRVRLACGDRTSSLPTGPVLRKSRKILVGNFRLKYCSCRDVPRCFRSSGDMPPDSLFRRSGPYYSMEKTDEGLQRVGRVDAGPICCHTTALESGTACLVGRLVLPWKI